MKEVRSLTHVRWKLKFRDFEDQGMRFKVPSIYGR